MSSLIPEGWKTKKIGDFLTSLPKSKLPSSVSNESGYYNFYVCSHNVLKSFYNEMSLPAVLFSTGGEAAVHYAIGKYSYSTDVWAINFKDEIYNEYAFRVLDASLEKINYSGFQGSGIKHLDKKFIKDLTFAIPPLPEQKKIASILTSVDEVIENTQKQIDKLLDLKKASINEFMTKGIGHSEFKDSELGRIPKSWKITTLENIGDFTKGKGISKKETTLEGIPCIRYAEIYTEYNYVIDKFKSFILSETKKTTKKLKTNDIIFAGSGETVDEIGKSVAFVSNFDAYVGGDTIIFSPNIECDSVFLSYQLNNDSTRIQLRKFGQGSSVIHVYTSGIKQLKIGLPPIVEQNKITEFLLSYTKTINAKRNKLTQTQSLKKSLMQDLLTGKVRVKVN